MSHVEQTLKLARMSERCPELRRVGVAIVRARDGAVIESSARYREVVHGSATAECASVLGWLELVDLQLSDGEWERSIERQLAALPLRPHVGATLTSLASSSSKASSNETVEEEEGLLRLEVTDVTARVRAEEQVTAIIESSFDGFWDWYITEDYEYMSPQFWRMFGYEPHEKEHKPSAWQDMVNQDDLKRALANFAKHVETRGEYPYLQEVRYTHKDGSTVWVRCKGRVVEFAEDGTPLRMVGTHTDITELKEQHAEERRLVKCIERQVDELQARSNEMRDMIYRANTPVIGFDAEGRITEWNQRIAVLTGIEEDEVVGTRVHSQAVCTGGSLGVVADIVESMRRGKHVSNVRITLKRQPGPLQARKLQQQRRPSQPPTTSTDAAITSADMFEEPHSAGYKGPSGGGGTIGLLVNSTVRLDPTTGKPTGGYILAQDLTQVVTAKEDAIAADAKATAERALNEYMAHEVRNPVFTAQAGIRFLREFVESKHIATQPGASEAAQDVTLVSNSLDYIYELLSSLLDLNKFLDGSLTYQSTRVNFKAQILDPVVAMLRRRAAPSVRLSMRCDADIEGCCDATRIKQVVLNLAGNALKFTQRGFVHVDVARDVASDLLKVRIEDSGVGISRESAKQLFKRFSQVSGHDQGSGIGLHLSRLVVEKIGGRLWIDNRYTSGVPGCPGSCFCFYFPFAAVARSVPSSPASLGLGARGRKKHGHGDTYSMSASSSVCQSEPLDVHILGRRNRGASEDDLAKNTSAVAGIGGSILGVRETSEGGTLPVVACKAAGKEEEEEKGEALEKKGETDDSGEQASTKVPRKPRLLLVDDEPAVRLMMGRLLQRALPEFELHTAVHGEEAIKRVTSGEVFEVLVVDHHMNSSGGVLLGTETISKLRKLGVGGVIVGCSGNDIGPEFIDAGADLTWRKPMTATKVMRDEILAHIALHPPPPPPSPPPQPPRGVQA